MVKLEMEIRRVWDELTISTFSPSTFVTLPRLPTQLKRDGACSGWDWIRAGWHLSPFIYIYFCFYLFILFFMYVISKFIYFFNLLKETYVLFKNGDKYFILFDKIFKFEIHFKWDKDYVFHTQSIPTLGTPPFPIPFTRLDR